MEAIAPYAQRFAIWAIPILAAVVLHEVAHGYVAYRLGDPTAARMGRLTLNPFAHVDLFGTVILPLLLLFGGAPFLFGYAKPVPVDFLNLRDPRRGMVLVALAGPVTNLLLAGLSALVLRMLLLLPVPDSDFVTGNLVVIAHMAKASVLMNVGLAVFNLLPVPPLDGGRVATGLLPPSSALALARVEPYGMLIIMALLMSGMLDQLLHPMAILLLQVLL
jgi:Zn-dependent protease